MKAFFALCCFLTIFMLFPGLDAAEWFTDFEKAKAESLKTNRPIFILFTSSDAAVCLSLERSIFSQRKFLDYADKKLVLMKADFSAAVQKQQRGLWQQNTKLRTEYKASILPTMLLLDATGKVYTDFVKADGSMEKHRRKMNEIMDFDPPKRYTEYIDTFVKGYKPPKVEAAETKTEPKPAKKPVKKPEEKPQERPQGPEETEETTIPDENNLLIPLDPEGDFQEWLRANLAEQDAAKEADAQKEKASAKEEAGTKEEPAAKDKEPASAQAPAATEK